MPTVPARGCRSLAANSSVPFKGESFPAYVAPRMAGSRAAVASSVSEGANSGIESQQSLVMYPPIAITSTWQTEATTKTQGAAGGLAETALRKNAHHSREGGLRNSKRPSLADQLKLIAQGAQDITAQLQQSYKLPNHRSSGGSRYVAMQQTDAVLMQATTVNMIVGRLECRFPCPVHFAEDHCSYLFQHPFDAKEIQMIMYYRDMVQVHISSHDNCFRFKINRKLHQFGDDYCASNANHWIKIVFASAGEVDKVKSFVSGQKAYFTQRIR